MTTAKENKSALRLWHEELETLIVATEAFRDRCGVVSKHDARQHVYWDIAQADAYDAGEELRRMRPMAVIESAEFVYQQYGVDDGNNLAAAGALAMIIIDNTRHPADHKQSKADFLDFAGNVIDQMAELSGVGDYAPLSAIDVIGKPLRSPVEDRDADDWWSLVALCRFDAGGG